MIILVAGGSGYLGSHLKIFLEARGHTCISAGRSSANNVITNFHDQSALLHILHHYKIDFVINLVAITNLELCHHDPFQAYVINAKITCNLSTICNQNSVPFLQISSDNVYSGSGPHIESSPQPINVYGITKLIGEYFCDTSQDIVLRTNFVGRSLFKNRMSLTDWFIRSLLSREPIQLYSDIYFNPLHVSHLCSYIHNLMLNRLPGVYNLASSGGISKSDFLLSIANELRIPTDLCTIIPYSSISNNVVSRPLDMRLSTSLLKSHGFTICNLSDVLHHCVLDYSS